MSIQDYTVVVHEAGKMPEIKLEHRPFSDCQSVGDLWTHNTVVRLLGRYDASFIIRTRNTETRTNVNGREYDVYSETTAFMGVAKLCEYYVVEN